MADGLPSVDAIARILAARTKTRGAGEAGTFTDATRPTADQVEAVVVESAADVYGSAAIGPWADLAPVVQPKAERVVAYLAAANVELAYWPEQGNAGRGSTSPYDRLMDRYRELREELLASIADARTDGTLNGSGGGGLMPRATMPANEGGMIGWGTNW